MTPNEKLKRNEDGLLSNPPVDYVFNEDGSVNWRKMVRTEFHYDIDINDRVSAMRQR